MTKLPPFELLMPSFSNELEKIAAKVPFIHGTNQPLKKLVSGMGKPILSTDPNPRGVYTAMRTRKAKGSIEGFAHQATERRGGTPTVVSGKMDTKKGWRPFNMKPKSPIELDEARDMAKSLDTTKDKAERGKVWKQLNQHVGSWHNPDSSASLSVNKSRAVQERTPALKRAG